MFRSARISLRLLFITMVSLLSLQAMAQSDFQITLTPQLTSSWALQSSTDVSSTTVYAGSFPASNPTLNLQVGKRYQFTNPIPGSHVFQVLAKAPGFIDDIVLLSADASPVQGNFENDFQVNWTNDGNGTVAFTLTSLLYNAMFDSTGGVTRAPGYRCEVHPSSMRGNFNAATGTHITDPLPPIPKGDITINLQPLVQGMTSPLGVTPSDDGTNRLFIQDQIGSVTLLVNGAKQTETFLDLSARLVPLGIAGPGSYDERGFLGFALHPNFAANPKVFTYTSEPAAGTADFSTSLTLGGTFDHQDVLAEWTVDPANPNRVDPASRRELFRNNHPQFNHNGGSMHFGSDGFLYLGIGDGGNANDVGNGHNPGGNAQDVNALLGKILRIDVDTTNSVNHQYGIPADNPFVGQAGLDEIYAFGVRNPYSFSFDSVTSRLMLGDVGQNNVEEIDVVTKGGNYGWRVKEGSFFFDPGQDGFVTSTPVTAVPPNLIDPIAQYDHGDGIAVVGGFVYHGSLIPQLTNKYVCAELTGRLFYLDDSSQLKELVVGSGDPLGLFVKGFGQDSDGEIYVCVSTQIVVGTEGVGSVMKIVPPPAAAGDSWTLY